MWLFSEIKTLGDIPRHYARTQPEKTALIDAAGTVTFAELDARSNRVANVLLKLGIEKGTNVAFLGKNSNYYFDVLFGASKVGVTLIPLNWRLAAPEIEAIVADASPAVIIVDREYEDLAEIVLKSSKTQCTRIVFDSSHRGASALDELMNACAPTDPAIRVDMEQNAVLMYTSGTTGKPKGVQLSHQGFFYVRLCEHLEATMKYEADDVVLTVMPLFHAMANYFSLQALYNGATVAAYSMPDPGGLMKLIAQHQATIVPLVPTAIQMLLDHPNAADANYSSVRLMIYAGASIDAHLLSRAMRAIQCKFMQFYGATETGGAPVAFLRPEQHKLDDVARLKSCGTVFPLTEMKVADENGIELPDGQVGEFFVRAPYLTTGYFNQLEVTAAAFRNGWYRSGDAGYRDAEGFFYIVDRVKDMIISGGENVYSTEVEHALQKLAGVQMCAVVGLPDPKWGEKVVAAIIADPSVTLTKEEVIAHCRTLIAGYKVPKDIKFIHSLPMTPTGKVKKRALRDQLLTEK